MRNIQVVNSFINSKITSAEKKNQSPQQNHSHSTASTSLWQMLLTLLMLWLVTSRSIFTRGSRGTVISPSLLLMFSGLLSEVTSQSTSLFPQSPNSLKLSDLNGNSGFVINGESIGDMTGYTVAGIGDFNGDGLSDVLMGAYAASPDPARERAGRSYVIYGRRTPFPGNTLELSNLKEVDGFKINGERKDDISSWSLEGGGDFNGDGLSDLVIGAPGADPTAETKDAGKIYVIFGNKKTIPGGVLELSTLNGTNGFVIYGENLGDQSGFSVSNSGDFNGDGLSDLVIGAPGADLTLEIKDAGKMYVIYGTKSIAQNGILKLSSLNGINGFAIHGINQGGQSGFTICNVGNFNGDKFDDFAIGESAQSILGSTSALRDIYFIFGSNTQISANKLNLSSLNGENGFRLIAGGTIDYATNVSALLSHIGDYNGDGLNDIGISIDLTTLSVQAAALGELRFDYINNSKIIGGSTTKPEAALYSSTLGLADLNNSLLYSFLFNITLKGKYFNFPVGFTQTIIGFSSFRGGVGDINDDGFADLAFWYQEDYDHETTRIQFGSATPTFGIEERSFKIDWFSQSASAVGDFNGDGFNDFILTSPGSMTEYGKSVVIFGRSNKTQGIWLHSNKLLLAQPQEQIILTGEALVIYTFSTAPSGLNITISNITQGVFTLNDQVQSSPFTFSQGDLFNQTIRFSHDGSEALPSYVVTVTDGSKIVGPSTVTAFAQFGNQIELTQGELLLLNKSMLNAQMTSHLPQDLLYRLDELNQVVCKYTNGSATMTFTQAEINSGFIQLLSNSSTLKNAALYPRFSFNIQSNNTEILPKPIAANINYYLQPIIFTNTLTVSTPGETVTVGPQQLTVNYGQDPGDDLTVTIDKVVAGTFSLNGVLQNPPFSFKAHLIEQNALMFTHDGSNDAPTYYVSVADGRRTAGPDKAGVIARFAKQLPPVVIHNQLILNEGERKVLTKDNLLVEDDMVTNPDLLRYYLVQGSLRHLRFNDLSFNRSNIDNFSQKDINQELIEVIHDGEDAAPSVSFQVSDSDLTGMPQDLNITFFANQPDAPELKLNEVLIKQGEVIAVTTDWLTASDSDAGDTEKLIIKVILSTHGYFRKVGEDVALMEFTRADVIANQIEFVHDGSSVAPEIKLQASDGMLSSDEQTLAVKFAETGNTNGVAIGIGSAIGVLVCVGLFAGGYAFYRKRQADLSREGNELDVTVSRIVYEHLNIKGVSNFQSGPGLKYVAQISEINQAYQRVNGEINDVDSYAEALSQAIKAIFSADADVISKGNSLSFNIADEHKRQPLRRQCQAIVERCRNSVSEGNQVLSTNNRNEVPMKTF